MGVCAYTDGILEKGISKYISNIIIPALDIDKVFNLSLDSIDAKRNARYGVIVTEFGIKHLENNISKHTLMRQIQKRLRTYLNIGKNKPIYVHLKNAYYGHFIFTDVLTDEEIDKLEVCLKLSGY